MSPRVELRISLAALVKAGACDGGLAIMRGIALGKPARMSDRVDARRLSGEIARGEVADEIVLPWDELGSAWAWSVCGEYCEWLIGKGFVPRSATAGYGGSATAGDGGSATAGTRGSATAGDGGSATAGEEGSIRIRWWDAERSRHRWAFGEVGINGILPNVAYVVGAGGALVRKDGAS